MPSLSEATPKTSENISPPDSHIENTVKPETKNKPAQEEEKSKEEKEESMKQKQEKQNKLRIEAALQTLSASNNANPEINTPHRKGTTPSPITSMIQEIHPNNLPNWLKERNLPLWIENLLSSLLSFFGFKSKPPKGPQNPLKESI